MLARLVALSNSELPDTLPYRKAKRRFTVQDELLQYWSPRDGRQEMGELKKP
jgi:hypothetical protein